MIARPDAEFTELIDTLRDFIDSEVIPREDLKTAHDSEAVERVAMELHALARARGLGAPRARVEDGGLALRACEVNGSR